MFTKMVVLFIFLTVFISLKVLISLDASKKLFQASQLAPQCDYQQLLGLL